MRRWILVLATGLAVAGMARGRQQGMDSSPLPRPSAAQAASAPAPEASAVAAKGAPIRQFAFTHLIVRLPQGATYATYRMGTLCLGSYTKTWNGGQAEQKVVPATSQMVREEMKTAGIQLAGDADNIFETDTSDTAETELGAIITDVTFNYCLHGAYATSPIGGTAEMTVEWQLYDKLNKTILAKVQTSGEFHTAAPQPGGENVLFNGVFRDNVRKLAASEVFRKALATPETAGLATPTTKNQPPIALPGSLAAAGRPIPDAVGSVVLIAAGQTEGSGFLVSSDGLVMTDQHVVGDDRYVKVRWADGVEGLGEVVRTDKIRDVALVKTDPRGRKPLGLRREPVQPGDQVFAIGAPMGDRFQNTVTRGIVSAYRTFDGLSFIQSDVNVNHGSSGGPLLDEKGQVVGLTEQGAQVRGAPVGINLFTPMSDALTFLAAQPK